MNMNSNATGRPIHSAQKCLLDEFDRGLGREIAVPFPLPVYARRILDCLNGLGISPSTVLARTGLAWQDLRDGRMMDFSDFQKFVGHAIQCSGERALGLKAGLMLQPYHSPVGIAAVTSENLGQSLYVLSRYARILFGSVEFRLENGPEWSILKVKPTRALHEMRSFISPFILGAHCRLLEAILGRPAEELLVGLPCPRSDGMETPYAHYVRRIEFDHEHLTFAMPIACLRTPCVSANVSEFIDAEKVCHRMETELGHGDFARRVRRALIEQLTSDPDAHQLASTLGVSAQTMARRLAAVGTKYSDLKCELRKAQATWYLQHTDMSIEAIALELGYTDTTNFSRAFKRWHRTTPRSLRRDLRSGSACSMP